MYDEFFTKAYELTRQGVPFATAIVVRVEKPTSGKPGDKAIITADGAMYGWIGGSCAQPTVIREALKALRRDESCFVRLSPDPGAQPRRDGLTDVPMTCFSGGTLEIFIEPQQPPPRLVLVGNLPVSRALAELARAMSYYTILVDVDHQGDVPPYADEVVTELSALSSKVTPLTSIVVATHGQYDELALEQALRTPALYIGLVASRRRAESVCAYLKDLGFTVEQLQHLKAPAGLDIQARRGDEIALSIMAEIVQRRRNIVDMSWQPPAPDAPATIPLEAPATAIDPVCHMSVEIAGAKYTYEYAGVTYYFCCPGCKTTFRKTPEKYLVVATTDDRPLTTDH